MEAFIFELGNRANKVEVLRKEDNSIEVKPKGWLGKKNWTEINEYKAVRGLAKDKIGEEGIDVIFEHIGKSVFAKAISLLKMGGTLVTTGATTGYNSNIDLRYLFFRGLNLIGSTQGTKAELEDVISWTSKGRIRPLIDVVLPFGRITDGYAKMASGDHFGKIVVTPQSI